MPDPVRFFLAQYLLDDKVIEGVGGVRGVRVRPAAMMTGWLSGLGKKVVWVFGGMN